MINKEKMADQYKEAVEAMDVSVDTDIDSQRHTQREQELQDWSEDLARNIASKAGVELSDDHFKVIYLLRDYYLKNGLTHSGRELGDMLDHEFSDQGGRKYLRRLFPDGPVAQGMRLAGLPIPANSKNQGFGTAR